MNKKEVQEIIDVLNTGKVAFFKSDTMYGLHAKADNQKAVEKIRQIKGRDDKKPFIILIGDTGHLKKFGVYINKNAQNLIKKYWPGKLTLVLRATSNNHLSGGEQTLAFRMPKDKDLRKILRKTGPVISTSANPSGEKPAANVEEARIYFGDDVNLYIDSGNVLSAPSTVIDCTEEELKILREGDIKLSPQHTNSYNSGMAKKINYIITAVIFIAIAAGVWLNIKEQKSVDHSKLPDKVEQNIGFQRWITNLKNKDVIIEADEFQLKEENELYNTKWMKVYSIEEEGMREKYDKTIESLQNVKKVVFSPSGRELIDYRPEYRDGYAPNEAHFYGLKEDKIIDARILDCSARANCYFDRAYFLDNDVFVISEFSRSINKKDETASTCSPEETCEYSIKVHVIDLINNKRLVYESRPFEAVMAELVPEL
ncbi:threonylcarbamoyl-AMP synthase [candidate division WWE3 bacterium RIFOXYA12_FULL_43_11]|nr:MAG: threonylcarbamoyl-AMP synthase [candidate division WWE3 bacterium RIFOXYA12_FULL_43_11]